MKFCKNLQKVALILDPEWAPYWPNYKMLKKLINHLPTRRIIAGQTASTCSPPHTMSSTSSVSSTTSMLLKEHGAIISPSDTIICKNKVNETQLDSSQAPETNSKDHPSIDKTPGEIAFFKMIHAEVKKSVHFFDRAEQEFTIREERVREAMEIVRRPNSIMVDGKWCKLATSIYKLYKDLLLLETYAIMSYCSFSKILKKHDQVTGYSTRQSFMENVVNKASFTSYPHLLEMISRCERLYDEVSDRLANEGKDGLYEDERLFIHMVRRLNGYALDSAENEGTAGQEERTSVAGEREEETPILKTESDETISLRSIAKDMSEKLGRAADENDSDDDIMDMTSPVKRPPTDESPMKTDASKRPRTNID